MRFSALVVALALCCLSIAAAFPIAESRTVDNDFLVRIRCSHKQSDETTFFFNGTVYYMGASGNIKLFNAVGVNIGRCFQKADGTWVLASRETMYYLDANNNIMNQWTRTSPVDGTTETVTVVHVDNDPVLQTFYPGSMYPGAAMVLGDTTIFTSDVVTYLYYPNNLYGNAATRPYAPYTMYQAAELFKFIVPTGEAFGSGDTVSSTLVSWTRTGPMLPWMKYGGAPGFLLYSFQGAKVPDWTYLPAQVKADYQNRVPIYQHAPTCIPATTSVTSWTFFGNHFNDYLNGAQFPLGTASYGCSTATLMPDNNCKATINGNAVTSWTDGNGVLSTQYDIQITNAGTKAITALAVTIDYATIDSSWNINRISNSNVYTITLWNNLAAGGSLSGSYGFISHGSTAVFSVASITCGN